MASRSLCRSVGLRSRADTLKRGETELVCAFQIEKVYKHIMPAWKKPFEKKLL